MQMVAKIPNVHKQEHGLPSYPPNEKTSFLEAVLTAGNYYDGKCGEQGARPAPQPRMAGLKDKHEADDETLRSPEGHCH